MKPLTIMYLSHCPYCRNAKKALAELLDETPAYREVPLVWIEESEQPLLADKYNYWRVPSIFMEEKKLFEASPSDTFETLKVAFEDALKKALA